MRRIRTILNCVVKYNPMKMSYPHNDYFSISTATHCTQKNADSSLNTDVMLRLIWKPHSQTTKWQIPNDIERILRQLNNNWRKNLSLKHFLTVLLFRCYLLFINKLSQFFKIMIKNIYNSSQATVKTCIPLGKKIGDGCWGWLNYYDMCILIYTTSGYV